MSIFNNAIDSIVLGVEDYKSADSRRAISATRNLVAGILLLIKHQLSELSPSGSDEVLIKQRILPKPDGKGGILWLGSGDKTVDVQQMRDRCTSLGITVDWPRVEKIVKHRNEVEHYFSSVTQNTLKSLLADSFVVIRDFLKTQLGEDPLEALGQATWSTLTEVAEVYEKEKKECEANLATVDWTYPQVLAAFKEWRCPKCGSGLIDVDNPGADKWSAKLVCRSCGQTYDFETAAGEAIDDYYTGENHFSIKDGGEPITIECPECSTETYLLDEDHCLICGESATRVCEVCGNTIPFSEIDGSGVCGYCRHQMSKDD